MEPADSDVYKLNHTSAVARNSDRQRLNTVLITARRFTRFESIHKHRVERSDFHQLVDKPQTTHAHSHVTRPTRATAEPREDQCVRDDCLTFKLLLLFTINNISSLKGCLTRRTYRL